MLFLSILILQFGLSCRPSCTVCPDEFEDVIGFKFDRSTGQFSDEEIGAAYLLRFSLTDTTNLIDTLQEASEEKEFQIGSADPGFENYNYKIVGTGTYTYHYWITDIRIDGEKQGECNCYKNTEKKCKVNGVDYDISGSDEVILLKK